MNIVDYLVLSGIIFAISRAVIAIFHNRKKGKSGCAYCPRKDCCGDIC